MSEMDNVIVKQGNSPLLLGFPHVGTYVPNNVKANLNSRGKILSDTDWHLDTLYEGLIDDVTTVCAKFHRYVIDPNRDPLGVSLYPGQNTTGLVPLTDFDGDQIWNVLPTKTEIKKRISNFHYVYHKALKVELTRLKNIHGYVILYDCHSIRSVIPNLFEGILPVFNIGTNKGQSCDKEIEKKVNDICSQNTMFDSVLNGRFTGGWTTRNYGQPNKYIHAIQMELSQSVYLENENSGWEYSESKAANVRPILKEILNTLVSIKPLMRR